VKPFLIVNPASAGGRTGRHYDAVARAVREALGEFDCEFTRMRGDGVALARDAARAGAPLVVAVGGDGTASEVADGIVSAGDAAAATAFGAIPRGTGGDLRRTLGWPRDVAAAAALLARGADVRCDLGRVEYVGHDGRPAVRHFVNVAGFGIAGEVVRHAERAKALPGKAAFMVATARALLGWSDARVRWRADGGAWREERITSVSVCNGRYFGGGMLVAPGALIDDGLFDVTAWKGLGLADFALKKGMLYDGTHVRLPNTERLQAKVIEAEPVDTRPVLLDVDGEQPGSLPARFTIVPGALRVRVAGAREGSA
jgi:YegS/Rv2252/BmrU family lipid kinase